jgi:hypothetical protein
MKRKRNAYRAVAWIVGLLVVGLLGWWAWSNDKFRAWVKGLLNMSEPGDVSPETQMATKSREKQLSKNIVDAKQATAVNNLGEVMGTGAVAAAASVAQSSPAVIEPFERNDGQRYERLSVEQMQEIV